MDFCDTRNQLLNEWNDAAALYAQLVASLVGQVGLMAEEDFDRLLKTVRIAADLTSRARKDFAVHRKMHDCSR
jgi:hypothetical protein